MREGDKWWGDCGCMRRGKRSHLLWIHYTYIFRKFWLWGYNLRRPSWHRGQWWHNGNRPRDPTWSAGTSRATSVRRFASRWPTSLMHSSKLCTQSGWRSNGFQWPLSSCARPTRTWWRCLRICVPSPRTCEAPRTFGWRSTWWRVWNFSTSVML